MHIIELLGLLIIGYTAYEDTDIKERWKKNPPEQKYSTQKIHSLTIDNAKMWLEQFMKALSRNPLDEEEIKIFVKTNFDLDHIGKKIFGGHYWEELSQKKRTYVKELLPSFLIKKYLLSFIETYPFHAPQDISSKVLANKFFLLETQSQEKSIQWQFSANSRHTKIINIFYGKTYFSLSHQDIAHWIKTDDFHAIVDYLSDPS